MYLTFGLFIATFVVLGLIVSSMIPVVWLIGISVVMATFQLYTISVAGIYLSASFLAAVGAWRFFGRGEVAKQNWYIAIFLLITVQLVAAVWSPNPVLALRSVLYLLPFLFLVPGLVLVHQKHPHAFRNIAVWSLGITVVEALLTILFRVSPYVESHFLASFVGRFFVSANILAELSNGAYTVFDPGKAGGFFVNANVAAAFLGFSGLIAWFFAPSLNASWLRWVAVVNLIAVLFAGSKAGIILGVVAIAINVGIRSWRTKKISLLWVAFLCFATVIVLPLAYFAYQEVSASQFAKNSNATFEYRLAIWNFAWTVLQTEPLQGLGFGGWELRWPQYAATHGYNPMFPPHNAFVALFVQCGILGVAVGAFFIASVLTFLWKASRNINPNTAQAGIGAFLGLLWLFAQAQGENYGLLGEVHMTPLIAFVLTYVYVLMNRDGDAKQGTDPTSRGGVQAPAVQAL